MLNTKPNATPSQRLLLFCMAFISLGMAAWAIDAGIRQEGAPDRASLVETTGYVDWIIKRRRSVRFGLKGREDDFIYNSKRGNLGAVHEELQRNREAEVVVLHEVTPIGGPVWSDKKSHWVYGLSVGGRAVRTHDEVDSAIRADNRVGIWLGGGLLIAGVMLFWFGITGRIR